MNPGNAVKLCNFTIISMLILLTHLQEAFPTTEQQTPLANGLSSDDLPVDDLTQPLAQRRTRRKDRQLPKRYRDTLPQPQPCLSLRKISSSSQRFILMLIITLFPVSTSFEEPLATNAYACLHVSPSTPCLQATGTSPTPQMRHFQYFRTRRNVFGLSRKYYGTKLPTHDPEEYLQFGDLCDVGATLNCTIPNAAADADGSHADSDPTSITLRNSSLSTQPFYPYPNQSSFLLGAWYWNQGTQKSQESFRQLIKIVASPSFSPSDVRTTNWIKINSTLAANKGDQNSEVDRWLGEDIGWDRTPISIRVPFHSRMKNPGPQSYLVGELHHRSIVSVIRERILNDHESFHYEPYELLWKPNEDLPEIKVHGELYTSSEFLTTYKELLESPPEPDCEAPKVIAALMFWSDATQLTSFGNAKLWPCYMYFGNHSKYQRMKPSCNLCNHIAYFQTVRSSSMPWFCTHSILL
jgi:hypothetical protein